jgi:MarR family transcriptional regulator, negative regulator of the multidrug operon emrRAB
MNNATTPRLESLAASLERLRARVPSICVHRLMLSRLLIEAGRGISTLLERHVRPYGLAEAEFRVLSVLFSQPDGFAHPSELCARTGQSAANMSRISDALVQCDLITRGSSATDRRRMVLGITATGEALVRELLPLLLKPIDAMFDGFGDPDLEQLNRQIARVVDRLDRMVAAEGERGA